MRSVYKHEVVTDNAVVLTGRMEGDL